jgi:hypothetical protein|tara:strand:+ start:2411 stop:2716 length:306 start_codon:yes stop_codon:yes gene_type:complete
MDRYKHTSKKRNEKLKQQVLKPTIYPKIPLRDSDIFIRPKGMERCEHVAYRFYGDQSLWWVIAQANNIHNGSIYLDSEKQIRVPQDIQSIMMDLESENKLF